jgi:hypothetical protein
MRQDYEVAVTRKDGSRRIVHVYGQPAPHRDDLIALPVDGEVIRAKIEVPETTLAAAVAREV